MDYSYDNLQQLGAQKGYNSISMRAKQLNAVIHNRIGGKVESRLHTGKTP